MSRIGRRGRSFARIGIADLRRLAKLVAVDRGDFFARHKDWGRQYRRRILCTALCQGAALHFVHGKVGINDLDVYTFYATHPDRHWYAKRRRVCDFGDPKFGQSVDKPHFVGRRVDILSRDIPARPNEDPVRALVRYLEGGCTETARLLAQKAVVLIDPPKYLGSIIWVEGTARGDQAIERARRTEVRVAGGRMPTSIDVELVLLAAEFAARKHRNQRRKDREATPYINHPLALARVLWTEGKVQDPVVIASALLHDTIEDTRTSRAELLRIFGHKVARIVVEVTDNKRLHKKTRKRLQIEHAPHLSREAKLVKLADKTCNLRDVVASPPALWSLSRKREYFDWAAQVVEGLRGANRRLERAFDRIYKRKP
jgi:guanosine-3',5'-bis(diphosphate) 3'-pyrophosphohydrolase